uniref:Uncharacterized protein n=1 Tax=Acrobeloides nanus TaxID=290746 RepID=A0A914CZ76_9BILA
MSLKVLNEQLRLLNEEDGLHQKSEKQKKRKLKKSLISQEREMVKNLDTRFDFDLEKGEVIKRKSKPSTSKGDVSDVFSQKLAKQGYSLVEQYRDLKSANSSFQSNLKSRKSVEEIPLNNEVLAEISKHRHEDAILRKKLRKERRDLKSTFYKFKPKPKKEESIFDEKDFENVGKSRNLAATKRVNRIL